MLKICLFLILFTGSLSLFAQGYEKEYEKLYAWEIKQMDEFIERFNNDSTILRQYVKKYEPKMRLTRERMIKSLFNAEGKNWDFNEINSFIKKVIDEKHPQKLSLTGENLYANLTCSLRYKNRPETARLSLQLVKTENGGSKWVIFDIDSRFLKNDSVAKVDKVILPVSNNSGTFLNPMSHATDFMNIELILKDKKNIANFFIEPEAQNNHLKQFIRECYQNNIAIDSPTSISYQIGQVPGWLIEIRQFNRQTKNSGWLISKIEKITVK